MKFIVVKDYFVITVAIIIPAIFSTLSIPVYEHFYFAILVCFINSVLVVSY